MSEISSESHLGGQPTWHVEERPKQGDDNKLTHPGHSGGDTPHCSSIVLGEGGLDLAAHLLRDNEVRLAMTYNVVPMLTAILGRGIPSWRVQVSSISRLMPSVNDIESSTRSCSSGLVAVLGRTALSHRLRFRSSRFSARPMCSISLGPVPLYHTNSDLNGRAQAM